MKSSLSVIKKILKDQVYLEMAKQEERANAPPISKAVQEELNERKKEELKKRMEAKFNLKNLKNALEKKKIEMAQIKE